MCFKKKEESAVKCVFSKILKIMIKSLRNSVRKQSFKTKQTKIFSYVDQAIQISYFAKVVKKQKNSSEKTNFQL